MKRDVAYALVILTIAGFFATVEAGFVSGRYGAAVVVAVLLSSLVFSMARKPSDPIILADYPGQDVLEATAGGAGVKLKGSNLPERLLGDRTVILVLICALAWYMWWHHAATEALLQKNLEATNALTYVISLPQDKRESLNLAMPESLRRQLKRE